MTFPWNYPFPFVIPARKGFVATASRQRLESMFAMIFLPNGDQAFQIGRYIAESKDATQIFPQEPVDADLTFKIAFYWENHSTGDTIPAANVALSPKNGGYSGMVWTGSPGSRHVFEDWNTKFDIDFI